MDDKVLDGMIEDAKYFYVNPDTSGKIDYNIFGNLDFNDAYKVVSKCPALVEKVLYDRNCKLNDAIKAHNNSRSRSSIMINPLTDLKLSISQCCYEYVEEDLNLDSIDFIEKYKGVKKWPEEAGEILLHTALRRDVLLIFPILSKYCDKDSEYYAGINKLYQEARNAQTSRKEWGSNDQESADFIESSESLGSFQGKIY